MIQRYGIDTSVLMRLVTGDPEPEFQRCVEELRRLTEDQGVEVFASNQVIGEAYVALQHHYGIASQDARAALEDALTSGLVAPLNGQSLIHALRASGGPGLFDRLIADGYSQANLHTLTVA